MGERRPLQMRPATVGYDVKDEWSACSSNDCSLVRVKCHMCVATSIDEFTAVNSSFVDAYISERTGTIQSSRVRVVHPMSCSRIRTSSPSLRERTLPGYRPAEQQVFRLQVEHRLRASIRCLLLRRLRQQRSHRGQSFCRSSSRAMRRYRHPLAFRRIHSASPSARAPPWRCAVQRPDTAR